MQEHVIEISTEVFRLLQQRAPVYVELSDERPGPTQKILVGDDVYREFIDRAIAHHQTLDEVVREVCTKRGAPALAGRDPIRIIKRLHGVT